jgi:hypothetical protein
MDITRRLKGQLRTLEGEPWHAGLLAVLKHIQSAERNFNRALRSKADFNDVIYRTNQAFEGVLKEAYRLLVEDKPSDVTLNQIEKALGRHDLFSDRVMDILQLYRPKWRNPSTHNHQLFFDETEALLALTIVSTLASLVVDRMIMAIATRRTQDRVDITVGGKDRSSLEQQVVMLLLKWWEKIGKEEIPASQAQLLGQIVGYVTKADPQIQSQVEVKVTDSMRADLVLSRGEQRVLVELQRSPNLDLSRQQMVQFLHIGPYKTAVLVHIPTTPVDLMSQEYSLENGGRLFVLSPR